MITPNNKKKELTQPSVVKKIEDKRQLDKHKAEGKASKLVSKSLWPTKPKPNWWR